MNQNVVATISHNKYKGVLLNNKYLRHSVNRIQGKGHKIRIYEINKDFFQNNRYDGLAPEWQS